MQFKKNIYSLSGIKTLMSSRNQQSKKLYGLGLALSGGGAKGFAHAGAIKSMEEHGLKPEIISGTSAGAIVGALYASGNEPEDICKLFMDKDFGYFTKWLVPKVGFLDAKRFKNFLKENVKVASFEQLEIPLLVIAADLDNGESVVFSSGDIINPVMASCSIPVIFEPVIINGIHYVDGGLFRNFPVSNIRDLCDIVIGVNVSPPIPQKYKQTILHIAERSYNYMFRANALIDRKLCDILVEVENALQYKTFDLKNIMKIFNHGYEAMNKALEENNYKDIVSS